MGAAAGTEPPRYQLIADELERTWARLPRNTLVESEMQLAERVGVNRQTAREVLRELERRTVVRRIVGRGTFTALKLAYPIERGRPPSIRRIVAEAGCTHGLSWSSVRWRPATGSTPRELVSSRIVTVEDLVALSATDRFVEWVGEKVADEIRAGASIFDTLASLGVRPWRRRVRVTMGMPDRITGERLGYVGAAPPTWYVSSETVDADRGDLLHRSDSWVRPDVFDVGIELDFLPDA